MLTLRTVTKPPVASIRPVGHLVKPGSKYPAEEGRPGAVSKKIKFADPPPPLRHRFHVFFLFLDK